MRTRIRCVGPALAAAVLVSLSSPTMGGDENDNGSGPRRFGASSSTGPTKRRIGNFKGGHLGASSFGDGSIPGQDTGANVAEPGSGNPQNGADRSNQSDDGIPRFSRRVGNTELRQWEVGANLPVDPSYAYWANWGTNAGLLMEFGWGFPFLGMGTGMPGMPAMPGMMSPNAYGGNAYGGSPYGGNVYGPSPGYGFRPGGVPGTYGNLAEENTSVAPAPSDNPTNSGSNSGAPAVPRSSGSSSASIAPPPQPQPQAPLKSGAEATESSRINADKGENEFRSGDYKGAVHYWKHAVADDPRNGVLTMLFAQSLFAAGQYQEAASATQAAMRLLPEDQWGVVVTNRRELYRNPTEYLDQLRALDKAAKKDPNDPALRFLAGFHYACLGYPKAAVDNLDKGLKLAPHDMLALKLRDEMQARLSASSIPPTPHPPAEDEGPR